MQGGSHVSERGVFSAIFGSMIQSGRFAVYALMTTALVAGLPWQWKFFLPAMIVGVFTLLTFMFVKDTPKDAGLGDFDQMLQAAILKRSRWHTLQRGVHKSDCDNNCNSGVLHGIGKKKDSKSRSVSAGSAPLELSSPVFQRNAFAVVIAGIAGAFIAGFLSDKVFKSRRPPVAFLGYVLQIISLAIVTLAPSLEAIIIAFTVNSLAISMVHSML